MAKILCFDIETAPMQAWVWGRKEQWIPQQNIEAPWFIICASWKWIDSKKTNCVSVLHDKERFLKDHTDDYHVIERLYEIIEEADVIVGHNSDRFDLKRITTRGLHHGLPPLKKVKTVDTLKQARKHFDFPSNKLDDIAEYFGLPRKQSVTMNDFIGCAKGDVGAIKKIQMYNIQDIKIQEAVFEKLRPYIDIPHLGLFQPGVQHRICQSCGSSEFQKRGGWPVNKIVYQRYVCKKCGKNQRSNEIIRRIVV